VEDAFSQSVEQAVDLQFRQILLRGRVIWAFVFYEGALPQKGEGEGQLHGRVTTNQEQIRLEWHVSKRKFLLDKETITVILS